MNRNLIEKLPPKFIRSINELYGAKGKRWLANLPKILDEICAKWSLEIERIFPNLSFNFVAACSDKKGEKYVLKVCLPEKDSSFVYEKRALNEFDGRGAVRILKTNSKLGAMLLECAVEGKTLYEVCGKDFGKAVYIAVNVMKKLPRYPANKSKFINLETWIDGLDRAVKADFRIDKVAKAQKFFAELIEPFEKKILLHGDIHFDNILSAQREPFLLIDPKGLIGEIGYEIAVFLNDLADWTTDLKDQKKLLEDSVEKFAEAFETDAESLRKWAFSFAVLSAWWMMEDFGNNKESNILRAEVWDV